MKAIFNRDGDYRSKPAKIAYGMGNLGTCLFFQVIGTYLIFFYTDVVKLAPALVSLAYAVSYGIWNSVNDPMIGYATDRTRTRWGRRIPYILFGAPLLFLVFVLLWSPPTGGKPLSSPDNMLIFIYCAIAIALFDLLYTAVTVPYSSLFPEMYESLEDRTQVSLYQQVAAAAGAVLAVAVLPLLVSFFKKSFGTMGGWKVSLIILGAVGTASFLVSLFGSRERERTEEERTLPLIQAFKCTLTNRSFLTFVGPNLMVCYIWGWLSAMVPYLTTGIIGAGEKEMGLLMGGMFISATLCYPIWRRLALKLGSKRSVMLAVTLFVLFMVPALFVKNTAQALIMTLLVGAANSGITLIRGLLLSDIIDEDELFTGQRREGSYLGANAFIERFAMVLVGGTVALVLNISGYMPGVRSQPASAVLWLRYSIIFFPAAALVLFLLGFKHYPLGKERVNEMRTRLEGIHKSNEAFHRTSPE